MALRRTALRTNDQSEIRRCQADVQRAIRQAKAKQASDVDEHFQSDPKSAWSNLHSLIKMKSAHKECSVDPNALNDFFCRFERHSNTVTELPPIDTSFKPFTVSQVYNVLRTLDVTKSCGPDKLPARLFRTLADSLAVPIQTMFNNSISMGTVPTIWKSATIKPVPKNKCASEPKDYRPIALTPILAKCLERLLIPYITSCFEDTRQFAYKQNRGTEDALTILLDILTNHLDQHAKNYSRVVFVDFSSAFNTIDPPTLINAMSNLRINSNVISWVNSFLHERRQTVKCSGTSSRTVITSTGSPQGCVLSPVLFTLYIKAMGVQQPSMDIIKYADDTVIIERLNHNTPSIMQDELNDIVKWCDINHLNINATKTKEMLITNTRHFPSPPPLQIHDNGIERVEEYRYLGTVLTPKLNFSINTEKTIEKANKRLYIMKRLNYIQASSRTINLAYTAFIESVLSYHLPTLYGHLSEEDKKRLQQLTKTAKYLSGDILECKSVQCLYEHHFKTRALRMVSSTDPLLELDKLPSGRCRIPKQRVNCRKFCFRTLCAKFYNETFF